MMSAGYMTFSTCYISERIAGASYFFLLGSILFFSANTLAAEAAAIVSPAPASAPEATSKPPVDLGPGLLEALDTPRDYLSEKVINYSLKIDHFFGDKRYFQENNESVVQIETTESMEQNGNNFFAINGQAKLDLPAATRRFRLVIESDAATNTAGEVKKNVTTPKKTATQTQYAASLRFEQQEKGVWHFSSELGANAEFPLDPFTRLRGSYSIPLGDWRMKATETVFWFRSIGLGETIQLDFEHLLSSPVLFRATSTSTCFETPQHCDLRQDLAIFHTLSDRAAMVYQASMIGVNQPVLSETDYLLLMRYRYRLHKQWMFFEINPLLHFPRTDNFKLNATLLLKLELLFGATK